MTRTAVYLPRGDDTYEPTRATESPWDRAARHGGGHLGEVSQPLLVRRR